jgi:hypothetical protein
MLPASASRTAIRASARMPPKTSRYVSGRPSSPYVVSALALAMRASTDSNVAPSDIP